MKNGFQTYYTGTITNPTRTFTSLIKADGNLLLSFYAVSVMAVLYTLVYVFLIAGGGQPFRPWLNIPLETYYQYNVFFCAPSMFLGWILAAGVVHTLSRIFTKMGTYEETLCVFGFGIGIASWTTGIHDLLTSFLGAIHVINQRAYEHALNTPTIWRSILWIQMMAYVIWFVILFAKGTKVVYKFTTAQAVMFGTVGFIIYQAFFFIFNR